MGFHLDWPQISAWIDQSRLVLIKKLSRNDCSWADDASKHQAGFYVPAFSATVGVLSPTAQLESG